MSTKRRSVGYVNIETLLETAQQILILRGGRTSGNWAHTGRPGKKGGSGRGGGFKHIGVKPGASRKNIKKEAKFTSLTRGVTASNIEGFLQDRRKRLESNTPLIKELKSKLKGRGGSVVSMYADAMALDKGTFDKYAAKLGIKNADVLKKETFGKSKEVDKEIAQLRWRLQKKNTLSGGSRDQSRFTSIDNAPLVGGNAKDAIDILRKKHNVKVLVDEGVDEKRVHKDLSRLIKSGDQFKPVGNTLDEKVKSVVFKDKSRYPGHTAVASFDADRIMIWTPNHSETDTHTLVHEVGHGAEDFVNTQKKNKVFSKGKRPSLYAWGNESENFAETFAGVLGGNDKQIKKEMGEQFDLLTSSIPGF